MWRHSKFAIAGLITTCLITPTWASTSLTAAKACRRTLNARGTAYANSRRQLLLSCIDQLLKCELKSEIGGNPATFSVSACRSTAVDACTRKIGPADDSSLSRAAAAFSTAIGTACLPYPFASVMSAGSSGFWFSNDATCGTSPDLATLLGCLRTKIEADVDAAVGRIKPRGALLLDNVGLGSSFPSLPRPSSTDVLISASVPGTLNNPGTISPPAGNAVKFTGDAVSLPCGGGHGSSGKLTITVGAGIACPPNLTATPGQQFILQEPWGPSEAATFGPFAEDQNYCVEFQDQGGPSCHDEVSGVIDYPPNPDPPPSSTSAALLGCQTRIETKARMFAGFVATRLHGCAAKVLQCKLANEIDGADATRCLASATKACSVVPTLINDRLTSGTRSEIKPKVVEKCGLVPFTDLKPFAESLGFSSTAAGCGSATNLSDLVDCIFGVTGPSGTSGVKCLVERDVFIRDPRAADSLTAAGLSPSNDFPCLGP